MAEPVANWARLSLPVLVIASIAPDTAVTTYVALRAIYGAARTTVQQVARVASVEVLRLLGQRRMAPAESLLSLFLLFAGLIGTEMCIRDRYQWAQQELAKTEADVGMMRTRAAAATSISAQYQGKAQGLNQQSVMQQDLLRDEKTQEENYLLYLHKREEARSSEALDRGGIVNVVIAQHPVTPTFPARTPQLSLIHI